MNIFFTIFSQVFGVYSRLGKTKRYNMQIDTLTFSINNKIDDSCSISRYRCNVRAWYLTYAFVRVCSGDGENRPPAELIAVTRMVATSVPFQDEFARIVIMERQG